MTDTPKSTFKVGDTRGPAEWKRGESVVLDGPGWTFRPLEVVTLAQRVTGSANGNYWIANGQNGDTAYVGGGEWLDEKTVTNLKTGERKTLPAGFGFVSRECPDCKGTGEVSDDDSGPADSKTNEEGE